MASSRSPGFPTATIFPMVLGTVLNPLNSSMIALALVALAIDFDSSATTVTWVVSSFYLGAAIAQPILGRFADRFGPRRVFIVGMIIGLLSGIIGPLSPNLGVLIGVRVLQAIGTSSAFPAAVALIRNLASTRGFDAQLGLSTIATANITGAAVGPVVGGLAMLVGGWQALFWINIPFTLVAAIVAWLTVPKDTGREPFSLRALFAESDPLGIVLFTTTVVTLILFVMSLSNQPVLWLALVPIATGTAFVWWEGRIKRPFLNLRVLGQNRVLVWVYLHFVIFNIVFYGALYGIPQWLESVRDISPSTIGFLMLPLAALGGLTTPIASRVIRSKGVRVTLVAGTVMLCFGAACLLLFTDGMPLWVVLITCALFGIPYAFSNLGLQTRMYEATSDSEVGMAAGLFQTARSLGGIFSVSILGLAFAAGIDTAALHAVAMTMTVSCAALLLMSALIRGAKRPTSITSESPRNERPGFD